MLPGMPLIATVQASDHYTRSNFAFFYSSERSTTTFGTYRPFFPTFSFRRLNFSQKLLFSDLIIPLNDTLDILHTVIA